MSAPHFLSLSVFFTVLVAANLSHLSPIKLSCVLYLVLCCHNTTHVVTLIVFLWYLRGDDGSDCAFSVIRV